MRTQTIALSLLLVAGFSAGQALPTEQYFPEPSNGVRWNYKLKHTLPNGQTSTGSISVLIDGVAEVRGETYLREVTTVTGLLGVDLEPEVSLRRWTPKGIYVVDEKFKAMSEYLETPFPLNVGDKWTSNGPKIRTHYTVEGLESLEIEGKAYKDCIKITFEAYRENVPSLGVLYMAKEVGLVKHVITVGGLTQETVLVAYEP